MSMRLRLALPALVLSFAVARAAACGACIEDRAAVVYDHAMVERAHAQRHPVVFFALDGSPALALENQRRLVELAESAGGVDKGSARVSLEPVSLALAFDAQRVPLAQLQRDLERRFAAKNVVVRLLQVLEPSSRAGQRRK